MRFAESVDVLCCNRREWESLDDREEVAWRVSILAVTDGPHGSVVRFTTPEGRGRAGRGPGVPAGPSAARHEPGGRGVRGDARRDLARRRLVVRGSPTPRSSGSPPSGPPARRGPGPRPDAIRVPDRRRDRRRPPRGRVDGLTVAGSAIPVTMHGTGRGRRAVNPRGGVHDTTENRVDSRARGARCLRPRRASRSAPRTRASRTPDRPPDRHGPGRSRTPWSSPSTSPSPSRRRSTRPPSSSAGPQRPGRRSTARRSTGWG